MWRVLENPSMCSNLHPPLQPGDLVFIAIRSALYRKVAQATGSVASHVGILFTATRC